MEIQDTQPYNPQEDEEQHAKIFKSYPQRWLVLFAFSFLTFANNLSFVQYSPIVKQAAQYYDAPEFAIVWLSNCYYVSYLFLAPFGLKPLEKHPAFWLIVASILTALGNWIKFAGKESYILTLTGFFVIGLGQIFTLAGPPFISNKWFKEDERTIASSIATFSNLMGINFALFYTCIRLDYNVASPAFIKEEIEQMNLMYGIICTFAVILSVCFIRSAPPSPPSYAAAAKKEDIIHSYQHIFKNRMYSLDLISLTMMIGVSWGYITILGILLEPYHYTPSDVSMVSFYYCLAGTVGGTFGSFYIDHQLAKKHKPNYDIFTKTFISIGFFGILTKALVIQYVSDKIIILLSAIIGFGIFSFLPICTQGLIETLFPASELVINTALMQGVNFFGYLTNQILVLDMFKSDGLWILIIMMTPFYLYIMKYTETKYHRYELEHQFEQKE